MTDMSPTVTPKSDQLNADDLIGGRTLDIKITAVDVKPGAEQKTTVNFEGDGGKPYKPGKMMCHVLIGVWGREGKEYIGRSLRLFRDDSVKFGPDTVGGVRISHMSHIDEPKTVTVPVTRGKRKQYTVQPLLTVVLDDYIADITAVPTIEGLQHKFKEAQTAFKNHADFYKVIEAKDKRKTELTKGETNVKETP